ncbi:MAG: hypothetical protein OEV91_05355 [Desulfobulbaceae bacterium]|nr:hypothetical protein [Desulfobulbaceae bacterium]
MSWIQMVPDEEATGELKEIYDQTRAKFGKVINLVKIQSLRPAIMNMGRSLYRHQMTMEGGLSRLQRVLIATITSSLNGCHY